MSNLQNGFLPEGYKEVEDYMRLNDGENKFRILSSAIVGWEYWNEVEGKRRPIRKHLDEDLVMSDMQDPANCKKFWAFIVWNYSDEAVQILEITQKGIRQAIQALVGNKKWGTPVDSYDLTINREGTGMLTKYTVQPDPKEPTDKKIKDALKEKYVNLEALFSGGNPFMKQMNENVNPEDVKL